MDIIFYGPLGSNIPKERVGGAETGCKRSIAILEKSGYDVRVVEKPTTFYGMKKFLLDFHRAVQELKLLFKQNPQAVFYLVGFYDRQICFEYYLCRMALKYGLKYIYEPKNGAMIWKYNEGNILYKNLSDYIFSHASVIFCQGIEYKVFLNNKGLNNAVYHPNYINKNNLEYYTGKKGDVPTFIYVGRVTQSKNIELILEIFSRFYSKHGEAKLYVVGGGVDNEYKEKLKKCEKTLGVENAVTFTGRLDFAEIANYLNQSHFFLFPSAERFEGHSNSVTEAMAFGVIPIASTIGFNASVIGDKRLLVSGYEANDYATIALSIWENDEFYILSDQVRQRALDKFSEDTVKNEYISNIRCINVD